jgi:hypothetical protein
MLGSWVGQRILPMVVRSRTRSRRGGYPVNSGPNQRPSIPRRSTPCASPWAGRRGECRGGRNSPRSGVRPSHRHGPAQRQAQVEMGEGVAHLEPGTVMPVGSDRGGAGGAPPPSRCRASPAYRPAVPCRGRVSSSQRAIVAPHQVGDALARGLGLSSASWRAGRCDAPGPRGAGRITGRSRRRAISACRSWRRGPSPPARSSPGARSGVRRAARAFSSGLEAGSGSVTAKRRAMTRSTLPSDHRRGPVEGDGGDGGGRIGPDPGQGAQPLLGIGKNGRRRIAPRPARISEGCAPGRNIPSPPIRP